MSGWEPRNKGWENGICDTQPAKRMITEQKAIEIEGIVVYLGGAPAAVLAGMEGIRYRQSEFRFSQGDTIYLYTDGVTEALNEKQSCLAIRGSKHC